MTYLNECIRYNNVDLRVTGVYIKGSDETQFEPKENDMIKDLKIYDSGDSEITDILNEDQSIAIEELALLEYHNV